MNASQSFDAATDPTAFRFTDGVAATWAFVYRTSDNVVRAFSVSTFPSGALSADARPAGTSVPDVPAFTAHALPAPPK